MVFFRMSSWFFESPLFVLMPSDPPFPLSPRETTVSVCFPPGSILRDSRRILQRFIGTIVAESFRAGLAR